MHLPHEKHVLPNGLEVVLHEEPGSPLVTVCVAYHVGSAREEPGRTGFAHLFEHMMFQGSEHVPEGEHFRLVQEAGGTLNGNTTPDRTIYFETLPAGELELALWLESDRMGFLLGALSQTTLDNQRDVVKEERRQNYENRPYGLAVDVLARELHPPGHPYSWPTIGSMADIEAASLEEVRSFFRRWYGPSNATLAIGGGFEREQALALVRRWFGTLPAGPRTSPEAPAPFGLAGPRRVVLEDRVAVPELQLAWPGPRAAHPDAAALDVLVRILSQNRSSVLDRALTVDEELAAVVTAYARSLELAGSFHVLLRPREGVSLERLESRVLELLRELGERGVDEAHIARVRTSLEAELLRRLELASARTLALAESNAVHGDPLFFARQIEARLAVGAREIESALRSWLVGAPHLALSIVPAGRAELALPVAVELPAGAAAPEPERGRRPPPQPVREFRCPPVERAALANGLGIWRAPRGALPVTRLELALGAGQGSEELPRIGLASLVAALLEEGTARLSTTQLQEALDSLGATLQVVVDEDELRLRASVLDQKLDELLALVAELVLEPRLERAEFERAKAERLVALRTRAKSATGLAADAWPALVHGRRTRRGAPPFGTLATVGALELEDARSFWAARARPGGARLVVVGAAPASELAARLEAPLASWRGLGPLVHEEPVLRASEAARIFLLDLPGAPQCELRVGHLGLAATDPDWFRFSVINFVYGGCFSSRLNKKLREEKGFTYGARSSIGGSLRARSFVASAAVRPDASAACVREMLSELERLRDGLDERELAFAKEALPRSQVRQYESSAAVLDLVDNISKYGWSERYPEERRRELEELEVSELAELAARLVRPEEARVLVVGDARALRAPLAELGLGDPIEIDAEGRPLAAR